MKTFLVAVADESGVELEDVSEAMRLAGYSQKRRYLEERGFQVVEAHHLQQLGQMNVHTFAAEIDLEG